MMTRQVHALWCDDIRYETNGKHTLVGVYADNMLVPAFPAHLPKLCLSLTVVTPASDPFAHLVARVLKDAETIAELRVPEQDLADALATSRAAPPPDSSDGHLMMTFRSHLVFSPFKVDAPCRLRVRIETEQGELAGHGLRIEQAELPTMQ